MDCPIYSCSYYCGVVSLFHADRVVNVDILMPDPAVESDILSPSVCTGSDDADDGPGACYDLRNKEQIRRPRRYEDSSGNAIRQRCAEE